MSRRILQSLFLLVASAGLAGAQADTWLEMRTSHFLVVSNSPEKEARHVAGQFERMRSVFRRVFPDTNIDTATPIVVLALADKRNFQALEPESYLSKGQLNLMGLFLHAPEKDYVLVMVNAPGQYPYAPIYHEYAHFVLNRTGDWMPLWLTEGWAEFYQTTEILDNEVRVGKLDAATWNFLQHNPLLPLSTLFTVDTYSPYYHEDDKGSIFYAESWALTHYLKVKDERENTHRLQDYLDLVHQNVDNVTAATQSFGDLNQLQADLRKSILNGEGGYQQLARSNEVDDNSFAVRTLTQAQADTVRADFLAYNHRDHDARILLEALLRDDPGNVSAHETMGYMAFRQRNFDEAQKWYEQSLKLDPQSFLAHYYFAASVIKKGLPSAAGQAGVENSLRAAIKLNPSFAPAHYGLGVLFAMQGKNYEEARRWIQKSIQMDPGNVEFRIDDANVLIRMNRNKDAVAALELALKMAHTPEETAAVENVLQTERQFEVERAKLQHHGLLTSRSKQPAGKQGQSRGAALIEPRGIYTPEPEYTEQAREARLEGACVVSFIVGIDGKPSNIVVTKRLGKGLDEKAVEAVRKWRFEPARRYGRPVMIRLNVSVRFKLFGDNKIIELSEKARTGDPAAEFELANDFLEGRDIPKDAGQGLALLERAARDGLPQAQFQMGERTYGDGSNPENYVAAYVWYGLAQRAGLEQSATKTEQLAAQMTLEQLSEARKRLENWTPTPAK